MVGAAEGRATVNYLSAFDLLGVLAPDHGNLNHNSRRGQWPRNGELFLRIRVAEGVGA